jgi:hypothetical protein
VAGIKDGILCKSLTDKITRFAFLLVCMCIFIGCGVGDFIDWNYIQNGTVGWSLVINDQDVAKCILFPIICSIFKYYSMDMCVL